MFVCGTVTDLNDFKKIYNICILHHSNQSGRSNCRGCDRGIAAFAPPPVVNMASCMLLPEASL